MKPNYIIKKSKYLDKEFVNYLKYAQRTNENQESDE